MSDKVQGQAVAEAIGIIKWVFLAMALIGGGLAVIGIELSSTAPRWTEVMALILTAAWCLVIWVLFGLAEYTLKNLIQIERNTRPRATEWVTPGSSTTEQIHFP